MEWVYFNLVNLWWYFVKSNHVCQPVRIEVADTGSDNNYRIFDERDVEWIKSLSCLKRCGIGIVEMKEYVDLCLEGERSISKRKKILEQKKKMLEKRQQEIQNSMKYIDTKLQFYDDVLTGKIKYRSNLIDVNEK